MQNNNLTRFNEGGLHHQNALGGIPVGNGNTVEEGETKKKNYVYSNRLSIDENMTKEMNLPSYIKGKTFASASKAIDNKFKDRNDKYSNETKNTLLDRLKQAQETLKQQEQQRAEQIAQSMQSNQQEVPDLMNGEIPQGMEEFTEQPKQFFEGGDLNLNEIANLTGGMSGIAGKASPYLGAATGALKLGSLAQGNGASTDKFSSSLNGAMTGAQAGMAFGPIGAGVGAALGIGAGLFGANKAKKQELKNISNYATSINSQFDDKYAYGGNIKQFGDGGDTEEDPINPLLKPTNTIPQVGAYLKSKNILPKPPLADDLIKPTTKEQIQAYQKAKGLVPDGIFGKKSNAQFELDKKNWTPEIPDTSMLKPQEQPFVEPTGVKQGMEDYYQQNKTTDTSDTQDNQGNWLDRNGGKILKYAPVAMNALQLAKLKKPTNLYLQRLDSRYNPEYVDESQLQNIANQEMTNTINSISQSGASQGQIRASLLGAGLNKTKALSDSYMKANAENRAVNDKAQTFNLGVNQFNTQTQHQEQENWEKNEANYRNEKSKYLSAIGTDLGEIGKEEIFKNQAEKMTGYSWMGDYLKSNPDYKAQYDAISKDSTLDDNMKYAKQKALANKIFQGLTPEQKKQAEAYQNSTRTYGLPQAYGGYLKMNKIGKK